MGGNPALDAMDTELALLLGRFSYYLQGWLSHGRSLQGVTGEVLSVKSRVMGQHWDDLQ